MDYFPFTIDNANLTYGRGNLNLKTFRPFAKNPPIAKVFREIGLADELGSGMRNSYKYTKMYSGGVPRSKREMLDYLGLTDSKNFRERYLVPLLNAGKIEMTIPDKPSSRRQKYKKVNSDV